MTTVNELLAPQVGKPSKQNSLLRTRGHGLISTQQKFSDDDMVSFSYHMFTQGHTRAPLAKTKLLDDHQQKIQRVWPLGQNVTNTIARFTLVVKTFSYNWEALRLPRRKSTIRRYGHQ